MKIAVTVLIICVAALLSLGMVMLYSSSMSQVGAHFLIQQLLWFTLGMAGCVAATLGDYRWLKKLAWPLFGLGVVMLVAVFVPKIGHASHGARRWIGFAGFLFQPSEAAKIILIIVVAWYGERFQRQMPTWKRGVLIPGIFIGVMLGLIFIEPDRGSTILLAVVCGFMLVVAGVRWRYVIPPVLIAAAALGFSLWRDPMRSGRIYSWRHLEETKLGTGHQAYQAMIAFGAGGWTGLGLGNGRQKLYFVPEDHTDFILPIIGEELGLIATLFVVTAFMAIVICGIYISRNARDAFGLLLGTGITILIGLQAIINIGVVTGSLPNKGLPLPFISYGGSNLVALLLGVGLLLSIAWRAGVPDFAGEVARTRGDDAPADSP
jgi:cell division protein FtsW